MKHTKRLGALALALVMALTALIGCGGGGGSGSASSSGNTSQEETIDLSKVTDPYLTVSGMTGGTAVATLGDEDITAAQVLYWYQETRDLDNALEVAALHCSLHMMAAQENLTPDPTIAQALEQEFSSLIQQAGSEELVEHVLWAELLDKELLSYFNESGDLFSQLSDLYYGENSGNYPTDADVMAFLDEGGYFKVKHILLMTVDNTQTITKEDGTLGFAPLEDETVAEKKSTADDLLAQLRGAADPMALFDQLMNEYSEDGGLATNPDGYIFTSKDSLVGGFREAALALEPGEISDIVETDYGYHIMLRLPIHPDDYRDDVVSLRMQEKVEQFQAELGLEKTPEFDKLDPISIMTQLTALQTAIYQEMAALNEQNNGASSSGEASSSASGSQG